MIMPVASRSRKPEDALVPGDWFIKKNFGELLIIEIVGIWWGMSHNLPVVFGSDGHRPAVGHFVSLQNPSKSLFSVAICSQ